MIETSIVMKIYKWKPFTSRPAGKLKSRGEDDVSNDLKKMKLTKWTELVQNRFKGKDIIVKAKAIRAVAQKKKKKKKKEKKIYTQE
jgi:hypothetical protein